MNKLKIDPEFRDKIPPLSADEFKQLEENIVADGEVREPLIVWNDTLIDGHHRWKIIQKHPDIPYTIKEMDFADKWAAISWMCSNQLGRRNITDAQKTYLLGKLYEARRNTYGGDRKSEEFSSVENRHLISSSGNKTRAIIASEQNTTESAVKDASFYSKGLDAAEEVSEGFREKVLSGEVKAPKSAIAELRKLDGEELKEAVEELKKPKEERKPKAKPNYADGDTRKTYQLIRELSEDAGNIEKETTYEIENAVNDLEAAESVFINQINFVLRNRAAVINESEETKEKVIAFFEGAIHDLGKMKEEIK